LYLFVLESIGTSELILIGIISLLVFGPRKLPELARKIGKMMAEFRGTANEFKQTWQREVDFEEESKALNIKEIENEAAAVKPVISPTTFPPAPAIKEIDPAMFDQHRSESAKEQDQGCGDGEPAVNDKRNWL
jgi:Tat protein translocase TatB subunit